MPFCRAENALRATRSTRYRDTGSVKVERLALKALASVAAAAKKRVEEDAFHMERIGTGVEGGACFQRIIVTSASDGISAAVAP